MRPPGGDWRELPVATWHSNRINPLATDHGCSGCGATTTPLPSRHDVVVGEGPRAGGATSVVNGTREQADV